MNKPRRNLKVIFSLTCCLILMAAFRAAAQESAPGSPGQVVLEGKLEITYQDFRNGHERLAYSLKQSDGTRVPLHFLKQPPTEFLTGDHVRASGKLWKGGLILYSGGSVKKSGKGKGKGGNKSGGSTTTSGGTTGTTTSSIPLPYTFGAQSTLVMLVNFKDDAIQPFTAAEVQNKFFGTGDTLNSFILENSYGQTWMTGKVVGWYTIPDSVTTCDTSQIATDANNAAVAGGAILSNYTRYVYLFPHSNACGFAGASTVGGNPSQSWLNGALDSQTIYHELGHAFGLWHSHSLYCGTTATICSNGTIEEYGDQYDVMGVMQTAAPDYNAFQKERLGWVNYGASPSIETVTKSGTYIIYPYEPGGPGSHALKVLKSTDPATGAKTWYYIEARQAIGFDSFLTAWPYSSTQNETTGVLLHLGTDGNGNSGEMLYMNPSTSTSPGYYDTSLAVGQSFTDTTAGVTFTTTAVDSTSALVQITF